MSENEKVFRLFLNLVPLQFVDVTVPLTANFTYVVNMWRNQGFLLTENDFIEWKYVIGIRELLLTPDQPEDIKAEKAKLN